MLDEVFDESDGIFLIQIILFRTMYRFETQSIKHSARSRLLCFLDVLNRECSSHGFSRFASSGSSCLTSSKRSLLVVGLTILSLDRFDSMFSTLEKPESRKPCRIPEVNFGRRSRESTVIDITKITERMLCGLYSSETLDVNKQTIENTGTMHKNPWTSSIEESMQRGTRN